MSGALLPVCDGHFGRTQTRISIWKASGFLAMSRETLERMRIELSSIPWQDGDMEGLVDLMAYWLPLFSELDQVDVEDLPPVGLGPTNANP